MIRELLVALSGQVGDVFLAKDDTFMVDSGLPFTHPSERDLLNRIVRLGWLYSEITTFIDNVNVVTVPSTTGGDLRFATCGIKHPILFPLFPIILFSASLLCLAHACRTLSPRSCACNRWVVARVQTDSSGIRVQSKNEEYTRVIPSSHPSNAGSHLCWHHVILSRFFLDKLLKDPTIPLLDLQSDLFTVSREWSVVILLLSHKERWMPLISCHLILLPFSTSHCSLSSTK